VRGFLRAQWRKPLKTDDPSTYPRLEIRRREFITIGSAVASPQRYRAVGRSAVTSRFVDVHNLGVKRELIDEFAPFYVSGLDMTENQMKEYSAVIGEPGEKIPAAFETGEAFRCRMLVPTMPALNPTPNILSAPRMPDWISDEFGEDISAEKDNPGRGNVNVGGAEAHGSEVGLTTGWRLIYLDCRV
jgi:hypothetical protein